MPHYVHINIVLKSLTDAYDFQTFASKQMFRELTVQKKEKKKFSHLKNV